MLDVAINASLLHSRRHIYITFLIGQSQKFSPYLNCHFKAMVALVAGSLSTIGLIVSIGGCDTE